MKTYRFLCLGYRAVVAESYADAAQVFAARLARRLYGPSGKVRTLTQYSRAADFSRVDFRAFVGTYNRARDEFAGKDFNLSLYLDEPATPTNPCTSN